jgi:hypothetical protein
VTRGASGIRPNALNELKQYFNDDQIVELTLVISVANFTNRFNDALLNTPDIGSARRETVLRLHHLSTRVYKRYYDYR